MSRYSLAQAEVDKREEIWVINEGLIKRSPTGHLERVKGNVLLTVYDNNRTQVITIPNTWIPINLCLDASKRLLIDNADLRKMVQRGVLKLMSPEDADKIFDEDPEAIEEQHNILAMLSAQASRQVMTETPTNTTDAKIGINPIAISACERVEISDQARVSLIRTNEGSFNQADWQYLLANCGTERIKEMAAQKLNEDNNKVRRPTQQPIKTVTAPVARS